MTERSASWFVWIVWAVALVGLMVYAASYAVNVPWQDEWSHVSVIAGERPLSGTWLWEQHNEHRFPIGKLIWLLSLRLSDFDFRILTFINVLLLGTLSAAMIWMSARHRGRHSYVETVFPLLILSPAQYENVLWGFQTSFLLALWLSGMLLLMIVQTSLTNGLLSWRVSIAGSLCAVTVPVFTAMGLVFGATLALWFGCLAFFYRQSPEASARAKSTLFLAAAIIDLVLSVIFLYGLKRPGQIPASSGVLASLGTALEFMAGSFGQNAGRMTWPILGVVVLTLLVVTLITLALAWVKEPTRRLCTSGLLLFLAGCALSIISVGWGRSGFGAGAGFASRYVTFMLPALCCMYFVWQLYWPKGGTTVQASILAISCLTLPVSVREAVSFGEARARTMRAFQNDLQAGVSALVLAERYKGFFDGWDSKEVGAELMGSLKKAGIGLFRNLNDAPPPGLPDHLEGFLDLADARRIAGWAWNPSSGGPVEVEIRDGATVLATVLADRFRGDLVAAHKGDGYHGFDYGNAFQTGVGRLHVIHAVIAGTHFELTGSPRTFE